MTGMDSPDIPPIDIRVIEDAGHLDDGLDAAIRRTLAICYPHHRDMFSRTRHWRGHIAAYRVIAIDADGSTSPTVVVTNTPAVRTPVDTPAMTAPTDAPIVAAHVAVVDRTIRVGDASVRAAGIAQVAALPPYRKTGLIDRVLARTIDEAMQRGFDMGLLFCREPVRRVYERNGWIDITDQPCVRIEADQRITMPPDNLRMIYPLRLAALPPGPVHLGCDKW